jgi:hypothetical protein
LPGAGLSRRRPGRCGRRWRRTRRRRRGPARRCPT